MRPARDEPATVIVGDGRTEWTEQLPAGAPDLALVDALARLRLELGRRGCTLRVARATPELRGLLELVGLADVLGLEPGRQPELGEQRGEDEVVQPRDPLP